MLQKTTQKQRQTHKTVNETLTNKTIMSETTTTTTKFTRLPANMFYSDKEKNTLKIEVERVIANLVKKGELKDTAAHKKEEIAKRILIANFRSYPKVAEIPAEFDDIADTLERVNAFSAGLVKMHIDLKAVEDEKESTAKQKAAQEKLEAKQAKDAEEKRFNMEKDEFEASMIAAMPKVEKLSKKISQAIIDSIKMPSSCALGKDGMSLNFAENASKAEIATAITTSISILGSMQDAEGAIQFQIGDGINKLVESGVFRKKKDAADHVALTIQEKLQKTYHIGHLQTYALMSERVPAEKRQRGVSPSKYLLASKLTAPRIKDASFDTEAAEAKVDTFRDEIIEDINSGVSSADLNEKIKQFKEANNFVKKAPEDNSARIRDLQNDYVWAELLIGLTVDDEVTTIRAKDKKTYTTAELVEIRDSALAELRKLLLEDKWDVKALRKGIKEQMVKGEMKEAPYRLVDPLWKKEKKTDEPEQIKGIEEVVKEEETEEVEVEEEVSLEVEDEEEDSDEIEFDEE